VYKLLYVNLWTRDVMYRIWYLVYFNNWVACVRAREKKARPRIVPKSLTWVRYFLGDPEKWELPCKTVNTPLDNREIRHSLSMSESPPLQKIVNF